MFSETRYAMNGDLRVAYRASPAGARDIVFVPNWFTCCEILPELPSVQGWVEAMTSLGRLIFLDLPGSGASDPVTPGTLTTLEQWADSITAVLDDLGSSEAAALFAATYPSRTTALVVLQCLAALASDAESHREAGRLFGAADALRRRIGIVRYKVYDADYDVSVAAVRAALADNDFESAWTEGSALSTDEAIAYAQRGRGERKRPTSGWAALTPTERDVVRLVSEGLGNKDKAFHLTADRADPPHPRLHQTRPHLPRTTRPRSSTTRLTRSRATSDGKHRRAPRRRKCSDS